MEFSEGDKKRFTFLLDYEMEKTIFPKDLDPKTLRRATSWMREVEFDEEMIIVDLAETGYLEEIKYLHGEGCDVIDWTLARAAIGGHLDIVKWVRELKGPSVYQRIIRWYMLMHSGAEIVEWLIQDGCPR